jgi:MerR family transcriptional regulator, light-induced transcriptional regulator
LERFSGSCGETPSLQHELIVQVLCKYMDESKFPIQVAARLAALSPYVIRIWEQRYQAVQPRRTVTNRRLYSPRDVERLTLLRDATQAGYGIGQIAALPTSKLRKLLATSVAAPARARGKSARIPAPTRFIEEGLAAVKALESGALEEVFKRASLALGTLGLVQEVLAPMDAAVG